MDATSDEKSWETISPGENGDGITYWDYNKPGVSKVEKTVILCDPHRLRPRANFCRQNICEILYGWYAMGMFETCRGLDQLLPVVEG